MCEPVASRPEIAVQETLRCDPAADLARRAQRGCVAEMSEKTRKKKGGGKGAKGASTVSLARFLSA